MDFEKIDQINLSDLKLTEFVHVLSSKEPAPGGGGAAALSASLGCALGAMVCNLTIGKKKYAQYEDELKEILAKMQELQNRFLEMIQLDKDNFLPLSEAYRLPSGTDEEKEHKEKVMEDCLNLACEIPIELAEKSYEAVKLHEMLVDRGTKIAISDVGVGIQLLKAALTGAKMSAFINTGMMKNKEYSSDVENRLNDMEKEASEICEKVSLKVMEML